MEKIQVLNGFRFREINVYVQAKDRENPMFQCWLTFVQEEDRSALKSAKIKYSYGEDEYCIHTNYNLEFFANLLDVQLREPGDMLHGDCNSYAAAVVEYIVGVMLGDGMYYDGDCMVMRIQK